MARSKAVARLTRRGHVRGLAELDSCLSYSAINEGRHGDGLVLLDRALPLAEAAGHWFQLAMVAGNLGLAALFSGDLARARDAFARQLRLCGQHVFRSMAAEGLGGMAAIAAAQGDWDRAGRLLGAAGAFGEVGSRAVEAELDHRFLATAREGAGPAAWSSAQAFGARMAFGEAIRFALEGPAKPLA